MHLSQAERGRRKEFPLQRKCHVERGKHLGGKYLLRHIGKVHKCPSRATQASLSLSTLEATASQPSHHQSYCDAASTSSPANRPSSPHS